MADLRRLRDRINQVDDGELTDSSRELPYSVVFPKKSSCKFIYTTKTYSSGQLFAPPVDWSFGVISRSGLPSDSDIASIAELVRDRQVYFLGDCDPFDLLVFISLRQYWPMHFLGTSDNVISAMGVEVRESLTISLSPGEQLAMPLVREYWPEFEHAIGPNCSKLLATNRKLEIEAIVSFRTQPVERLIELLG